jgi:DNA-binding transcriptional MerR regulator
MSNEQEFFATEPGVDEGVGQIPTAQDATATTEGEYGQPADSTRKPKVNLDELEEFRQWKANADSRIARAETAAQRADRERQDAHLRLAQYEAQLEQLQTRDLDDVGKARFEADKYRRQAEVLQQQIQQSQIEQGRQQLLGYISQQTGVSVADITAGLNALPTERQSADMAWTIAAQRVRQAVPQKAAELAQQRTQKREANQVDIGSGAPVTVDSQWNETMSKHQANNDAFSYAREILRQRGYS